MESREMWLVPIPKYVFFFPLVWEGRRWDESTGNYQERNDPTFLWLLNYNEYLEKEMGQAENKNLGSSLK